jgi:hypothetical protein
MASCTVILSNYMELSLLCTDCVPVCVAGVVSLFYYIKMDGREVQTCSTLAGRYILKY